MNRPGYWDPLCDCLFASSCYASSSDNMISHICSCLCLNSWLCSALCFWMCVQLVLYVVRCGALSCFLESNLHLCIVFWAICSVTASPPTKQTTQLTFCSRLLRMAKRLRVFFNLSLLPPPSNPHGHSCFNLYALIKSEQEGDQKTWIPNPFSALLPQIVPLNKMYFLTCLKWSCKEGTK